MNKHSPFNGNIDDEIITNIINTLPLPLNSFYPTLNELYQQMTDKNYLNRPNIDHIISVLNSLMRL